MINHLINDIIVMGAKPLAVLDVIVVGKLIKDDINKIITAINQACINQDCSLVGGEISEQPGVLSPDVFVLSSSVVGVVSKKKIIDGSRIKKGDKVIAMASNGLHTNGYSLVRKLITDKPAILKTKVDGKAFIDAVLQPHTAYYLYLKDILASPKVRGLAHITGDGICGNLERILPEGLSALVHLDKIEVLQVFKAIKTVGGVPEEDMINNLNIGVGMIMVTGPKEETPMIQYLENKGIHTYHIGEIITDEDNTVKFSGKLNWGK
jgi:phosphoribosylformylglycinamidine cyclo-ligase